MEMIDTILEMFPNNLLKIKIIIMEITNDADTFTNLKLITINLFVWSIIIFNKRFDYRNFVPKFYWNYDVSIIIIASLLLNNNKNKYFK